VVNPSGVIKAK